jgi:amino acid transporter
LDELPYQAALGVWGSYLCVLINVLALIASFYTALFPVSGDAPTASVFFQNYLAGPLLIFLYLVWKVYSWFTRPADRPIWVKIRDIDIYSGMRESQTLVSGQGMSPEERRHSIEGMERSEKKPTGFKGRAMGIIRNVI